MTAKMIQRLEKLGRIRTQKVSLVQIENMLREAILDLREAGKIVNIAERATYLLAYMAMLKAGRAVMLLTGYIPADGGQHKTVVEATRAILGEKYENLSEQFETMRRKRNEMTYEAGLLLTKSESEHAYADAIMLVQTILDEVKSRNPQMELKFEIDGERS